MTKELRSATELLNELQKSYHFARSYKSTFRTQKSYGSPERATSGHTDCYLKMARLRQSTSLKTGHEIER